MNELVVRSGPGQLSNTLWMVNSRLLSFFSKAWPDYGQISCNMEQPEATETWKTTNIHSYWKTERSKHVVQIYENDQVLYDSLESFARSALRSDEACVIIGRKNTNKEILRRLTFFNYDVTQLRLSGQLITLDAEETLALFMRNEKPDEKLFFSVMENTLLASKRSGHFHTRAFGEMVAILWSEAKRDATIRLEKLWNRFCESNRLTLFCGYPAAIMSNDAGDIMSICNCHSETLDGHFGSKINVKYRQA